MSKKIAIIGAGISAAACASELLKKGFDVTVFEKSRGAGGRLSSKYLGEYKVDLGAQYFSVTDAKFLQQVIKWEEQGLLKQLNSIGVGEFYISTDRLNLLAKNLFGPIKLIAQTRIANIVRKGKSWQLTDEIDNQYSDFDEIVLSAPPQQTADLLVDISPDLSELARSVKMLPCWTLVAIFSEPLKTAFGHFAIDQGVFSRLVCHNAKAVDDTDGEAWVLQANSLWSEQHIDADREEVSQMLLDEFLSLCSLNSSQLEQTHIHRWLYSQADQPLNQGALHQDGIGLCGDWLSSGDVQGAYLSGIQLASLVG